MKKNKFPRKAKLISNGFYKIISVKEYTPRIFLPILKEIKINTINLEENINFSRELVFQFDRVFRGYAEYRQIDVVKVK